VRADIAYLTKISVFEKQKVSQNSTRKRSA
jgi:hypothetical protein